MQVGAAADGCSELATAPTAPGLPRLCRTAERQQSSCPIFSVLPTCNMGTNDKRTKTAPKTLPKVGHSIFHIDLLTETYLQLFEANYFTHLN